jgi:NADH-quinone oxidoreductase subunit L
MTRTAQTTLLHDYHLLSYDQLDSTNAESRRLAGGGASHGAVIWAKRQTAGRGPYTYAFMWIGSLALAGIPVFAGFYSKDGILEAAYAAGSTHGYIAFALGIAAAFMTAFYSWRLLFMTFHGTPRADKHTMDHVHESPRIMLLPLIPLVLGALFAGAIGFYAWGILDPELLFWNGSITILGHGEHAEHHAPFLIHYAPLIAGVSGIALAFLFYIRRPELPVLLKMRFAGLYKFLLNKWYFDELYDWLFVRRAVSGGQWLWRLVDTRVIDNLGPNGAAFVSRAVARRSARAQTGYLYHYAFSMIIGLLVLVSWLLYTVNR